MKTTSNQTITPSLRPAAWSVLAFRRSLAGCAVLIAATLVKAAVLNVPLDFPTIQAAINAASPGDIVQVAAGSYEEVIDLRDGVALEGAGADLTIIEGNGERAVIRLFDAPSPLNRIQGFTIRGGTAGIAVNAAHLSISGNRITGNLNGGGIRWHWGDGNISGNEIIDNKSAFVGGIVCDPVTRIAIVGNQILRNVGDYAGGILVSGAVDGCAIRDNVISDNKGYFGGIGLGTYPYPAGTVGGMEITGNTVSDNIGDVYGAGGIGDWGVSGTIANNLITRNSGDGITFGQSTCSVIDNTVSDNRGGGIRTQEDVSSIIRGNTISENALTIYGHGAGIYAWVSDAIIEDNVVTGNTTWKDGDMYTGMGGGIACNQSHNVVRNNVIRENYAGGAGGIVVFGGSSWITHNRIERNHCEERGGGIRTSAQAGVVADNTVAENYAGEGGGIVVQGNGDNSVTGNKIKGNVSLYGGGGIAVFGRAQILDNEIQDNSAGHNGGGLLTDESGCDVIGNLIRGNHAAGSGGGCELYVNYEGLEPLFANNVVADNESGRPEWAAVVYTMDAGKPMIVNNTVLNNGGTGLHLKGTTAAPEVKNNILWGHALDLKNTSAALPDYCDIGSHSGMIGGNNLSADPLIQGTTGGNYWLLRKSPCVDAGINDAVPSALVVDYYGQPRIQDGNNAGGAKVDLGAAEHAGPRQP